MKSLRTVAFAAIAVMISAAFPITSAASAAADPPGTVWLCRPGIANNPCDAGLDTTVYKANGTSPHVDHPRADPKIDCFYVYPTTSDQKAVTANFDIDPELRSIALFQAGRFSEECRVFAPVYRQITIIGLGGGATPAQRETAYQDVRSAWLDYLQHDNNGRGVVFIGHSQGSGVLRRLLREEVDPNPAVRAKLVSALLLGGGVTVKKGSDRGGDFQNIRACHTSRQLGCVIAYSTFDEPVPASSFFGRTSSPGLEVLCTNPAALRGNSGLLDPIYPTEPFAPGTAIGAVIGILGVPPTTATTPWVAYRNAYQANCTWDNGANVLRVTPVNGAPFLHPSPDATWGLHLVDVNIALGNLVSIVHQEAHQYVHVHRGAHQHRLTR